MILTYKNKILIGVISGIIVTTGVLWYYQQQGFLKIFPTREDLRNRKILTIDRSKFSPAQGLSTEEFEAEIKKLTEERDLVLKNPKDAQAWFNFGYTKEFLNDHEGAVLAWEQSFELQPLNFVTAQNLANDYQYFLKDPAKAEFYYQKVLELRPDYTLAYQGLADLYRFNWKEKQDQLETVMLEAVKKDPENQQGYYVILVEFFASMDLNKAKNYLTVVRQLDQATADELVEAYPALK